MRNNVLYYGDYLMSLIETTSYLTIPGWKKIGGASLYQDPDVPLEALKRSLEIYVPANKTHTPGERAGVINTGKEE